jgi:electron transfer flavoprotein alpha subunit
VLAKAQSLATTSGEKITTVLMGDGTKSMAAGLAPYCDLVLAVDDQCLGCFNAEIYEKVLSEIICEMNPSITLMSHTSYGMELSAHLATAVNAALVTDCVNIEKTSGGFTALRKTYGGKVDCRVSMFGERFMATLRPGVFGAATPRSFTGKVRVYNFLFDELPKRKRFVKYLEKQASGVDITKADIIIDAGRGVKNENDLEILRELADTLGGVVACSRPIVDKGWMCHDRQIGTSGKVVRSRLLIAVGVSGAYQHLGGIEGCDTIVSINEDPNAPILSVADYAIVNDLYDVLPVLNKKIRDITGYEV